jgi:hypothetical protein
LQVEIRLEPSGLNPALLLRKGGSGRDLPGGPNLESLWPPVTGENLHPVAGGDQRRPELGSIWHCAEASAKSVQKHRSVPVSKTMSPPAQKNTLPSGYSLSLRKRSRTGIAALTRVAKKMKLLTGYLATLDVLGFSELLYRDGYAQQLRQYLDCVNSVVSPTDIEAVLFSDSVVLTSPGETSDAFRLLVVTSSAVFHGLLRCGMPVRGAVAFGHYRREAKSGSVFLAGRPIVEAYRRERAQKWIGTLLCPSVLHKQSQLLTVADVLTDSRFGVSNAGEYDSSVLDVPLRLAHATVPFEHSPGGLGELSGYAIVPLGAEDNARTASRSIGRTLSSLDDLRLKASEPHSQAKYGASIKWLKDVRRQFDDLAEELDKKGAATAGKSTGSSRSKSG